LVNTATPTRPDEQDTPTMTDTAKGLTLSIYTNPRYARCSNGGLSEQVTEVTLVGIIDTTESRGASTVTPLPDGSRVFTPTEAAPPVYLVIRQMGQRRLYHVTPAANGGIGRYMAGGAYVATSDSRFSELIGGLYGALSLHDRTE
jgi:hypothetical protein